MTVTVNGSTMELGDRSTVADAVAAAGKDPDCARGVAVAINGEVVPRTEWPQTTLSEGDKVEVLTAVAGG